MLHSFAGVDFQNAVSTAGFELVAIEAVGEVEVGAAGDAAEFAQQRMAAMISAVPDIQIDALLKQLLSRGFSKTTDSR